MGIYDLLVLKGHSSDYALRLKLCKFSFSTVFVNL
jgi:hypothetical protein